MHVFQGAVQGGACQLAHSRLIQRRQVERAPVRVAVAEDACERVRVLQCCRLLCRQACRPQVRPTSSVGCAGVAA